MSASTGAIPPLKASAAAPSVPSAETPANTRVASRRSTISPAWPATATDGPKRQTHRAATTSPESATSFT